jgi:hypothetical protein
MRTSVWRPGVPLLRCARDGTDRPFLGLLILITPWSGC